MRAHPIVALAFAALFTALLLPACKDKEQSAEPLPGYCGEPVLEDLAWEDTTYGLPGGAVLRDSLIGNWKGTATGIGEVSLSIFSPAHPLQRVTYPDAGKDHDGEPVPNACPPRYQVVNEAKLTLPDGTTLTMSLVSRQAAQTPGWSTLAEAPIEEGGPEGGPWQLQLVLPTPASTTADITERMGWLEYEPQSGETGGVAAPAPSSPNLSITRGGG